MQSASSGHWPRSSVAERALTSQALEVVSERISVPSSHHDTDSFVIRQLSGKDLIGSLYIAIKLGEVILCLVALMLERRRAMLLHEVADLLRLTSVGEAKAHASPVLSFPPCLSKALWWTQRQLGGPTRISTAIR